MITRYPILEFLYNVAGTYKAENGEFELELRKNGYDFVLLTKGAPSRSQLYGVIGVAGESLKLYASIGFSNIYEFSWPYAFDETSRAQQINFQEKDGNISLSFVFEEDSMIFSLKVGESEGSRYVLRKA